MNERGFILVEASMTSMILALALVALLPFLVLAIRADTATQRLVVATRLSQELLEEVRWRSSFDTVDRFDGAAQNPPQDPLGAPLAKFSAYTRSVAVRPVADGLKQVTVCTRCTGMKPVCLDTLLARR